MLSIVIFFCWACSSPRWWQFIFICIAADFSSTYFRIISASYSFTSSSYSSSSRFAGTFSSSFSTAHLKSLIYNLTVFIVMHWISSTTLPTSLASLSTPLPSKSFSTFTAQLICSCYCLFRSSVIYFSASRFINLIQRSSLNIIFTSFTNSCSSVLIYTFTALNFVFLLYN